MNAGTDTTVLERPATKARAPRAPKAADPAAAPLAVIEGRPDAGTLIRAIAKAAANPDVDIEKMERLWAMQRQMVAQEAEAAFNDAMARAQAKITPVVNNAHNDQTQSNYAKLSAINKAIMPIYSAEGLSVSFDTDESPIKDHMRIVAIVSHAAGHSRRYHLDMPLDNVGIKGSVNKTMVHARGSTASYTRRYLVCMIFNVSTEDDNDGNGVGGGEGNATGQQQADDKSYPAEKFERGLKGEWAALIASGKKTAEQIITTVSSKWELSDDQKKAIRALPVKPAEPPQKPTFDSVKAKLTDAATVDQLFEAADLIGYVSDADTKELQTLYYKRKLELEK